MQTCNLKSMKQSKITNLLIVVFLIFSVLIPTINLSAREVEKKRGYKGTISKEKILSIFIKNECVVGHVIKGDDIIEIIKATDHEIRISDSIIEGGLNFTKLPAESWEKVKLPKGWNTQAKQAFIKREFHLKNVHIVKNRIDITNSEIRDNSVDQFSINAVSALFFKQNSYRNVVFSGEANFSYAGFSGEAYFGKATFSGGAYFAEATFSGGANFGRATFSGNTIFLCAAFSGKAYFGRATFSGDADFIVATFSGEADFTGATFSGEADFTGATFSGNANFGRATFSGDAYFGKTTFSGDAYFSMASFIKLAYFNRSRFLSSLLFSNVDFREYADIRNTQIRRLNCNSVNIPTVIKGRLDFRNSIILEAHIQDFIFEKNVYFSDSKFGVFVEEEKKESVSKTDKKPNKRNTKVESSVATVFRFVTFESYADFKRTEFLGNTAFENVNFIQDANFTDADFKARKDGSKQNFSLSYLNFKNLFIKWDQLPNIRCWVTDSSGRIKSFVEIKEEQKKKPESGQQRRYEKKDKELEPLSHVFKGLEANFRTINQLSDANQAYYHRKKAELKETKNGDNSWLMTQREAEWIFWGIPCGYGTKIYWIIGWSALITLLFAVIYSIKGELNRQPHPKTKQEFNFKQRLFDFPKEYCSKNSMVEVKNHSHSARKFINALRFSAVILFKVGYRDTTISGKILGIDYKYILWLEWALGYYILIALVVTLSNTLPIVINWLITGVF